MLITSMQPKTSLDTACIMYSPCIRFEHNQKWHITNIPNATGVDFISVVHLIQSSWTVKGHCANLGWHRHLDSWNPNGSQQLATKDTGKWNINMNGININYHVYNSINGFTWLISITNRRMRKKWLRQCVPRPAEVAFCWMRLNLSMLRDLIQNGVVHLQHQRILTSLKTLLWKQLQIQFVSDTRQWWMSCKL